MVTKIEEQYNKWSKDQKEKLETIYNDIRLMEHEYDIYVAIDFYDIIEYCFPFKRILDDFSSFSQFEFQKKNYIERQLSRIVMFFMLSNLYPNKLSLLPPYIREGNDFFIGLNNQIGKYISNEEIIPFIKKLILDLSSEYKAAKAENKCDRILSILNTKSPELMFVSSQSWDNGLVVFKDLMKYKISTNFSIFGKLDENESYEAIPKQILENGNIDILNLVRESRKMPHRFLQDKRDAEAIRYVIELNKLLKKHKKLVFLVSSAPHMVRFMNENPLLLDINGIKFSMMRDTDYFYKLALEISRLQETLGSETDLKQFDKINLKKMIEKDLTMLNTFLKEEPDLSNLSGILSDPIKLQHLNEVIVLNEKINNIDLSFHIQDFLPKGNISKSYSVLNIINQPLIREFEEILENIKDSLRKNQLMDGIFNKSVELEKERLKYLWPLGLGNLTFYRRDKELGELETVLFSLPFKVYFSDARANEIFQSFVELNKRAKEEFKKNYELADETLETIFGQLELLSLRADELNDDERFILMSIIFGSVGRHDLIKVIYKFFVNKIPNEEIKQELSYLYIINFVKIMRKRKQECSIFKEMLEICDRHRLRDPESMLVYSKNAPLIMDLSAKKIDPLTIPNCLFIDKDTVAIVDNSYKQYVYIIKLNEEKNNIKVYDFRFVHLKQLLLNRYLKDFNQIDQHDLLEIKLEFENIFKPIADNLFQEFKIVINSDYAYLLALNVDNENYDENLQMAKGLMLKLKEESIGSPYWNYSKFYILGFILLELAKKDDNVNRKEMALLAKEQFESSLKEIAFKAEYLRKVVMEFMDSCDKIIKS